MSHKSPLPADPQERAQLRVVLLAALRNAASEAVFFLEQWFYKGALLVFCILLLTSWVSLVVDLVTGGSRELHSLPYPFPLESDATVTDFTLGFALSEEPGGETINTELVMIQLPPTSLLPSGLKTCIRELSIELDSADFVAHELFAVSAVEVMHNGPLPEDVFPDLCTSEESKTVHAYNSSGSRRSEHKIANSWRIPRFAAYYYPLDLHKLSLEITLTVSEAQSDGEEAIYQIAPNVRVWPEIPSWDETISEGINWWGRGAEQDSLALLTVELERPLHSRLLTLVVLGSLLLFIGLLVLVKDTSSFLEVAIVVLLGLWGVQDILVPADVQWATMIDPLILSLYLLFALAVFFRFVAKPLWRSFDAKSESGSPSQLKDSMHAALSPQDNTIQFTVPSYDNESAPPAPSGYQKATLALSLITVLATLGLLFKRNRRE